MADMSADDLADLQADLAEIRRLRDVAPSNNTPPQIVPGDGVQVPLCLFYLFGDELEIAPGVWLRNLAVPPYPEDEEAFAKLLWQNHRPNLHDARKWLCFSRDADLDQQEVLNAFLLALWVAVPTETFARYMLGEVPMELQALFAHVPHPHIKRRVTLDDMERVKVFFPAILGIRRTKGRLQEALHLTFGGCIQSASWQVAVVSYMAALEALVSYERTIGGTVNHIQRACELLVRPADRKLQNRRIAVAYDVRNDIAHGMGYKHVDGARNLAELARVRDLLRDAWAAVLPDPAAIAALEGDDGQRRVFLEARAKRKP